LQLMEMGADINVQDVQDRTPLHYAVLHNHKEVTACLLEHLADIEMRDREGSTLGKFHTFTCIGHLAYCNADGSPLSGEVASLILSRRGMNFISIETKLSCSRCKHMSCNCSSRKMWIF